MTRMAETLRLTPHETVTIRESSPELLEVEGSWGPGGRAPPVHYHPAQDEHFEVLDGLKAGDTVVAGPYQAVRDLKDSTRVRQVKDMKDAKGAPGAKPAP